MYVQNKNEILIPETYLDEGFEQVYGLDNEPYRDYHINSFEQIGWNDPFPEPVIFESEKEKSDFDEKSDNSD